MSIYFRREFYREQLFLKDLNLKKAADKVLEVLPVNYSFDDFINSFRQCFSYKWDDVVAYCEEKKRDYYRRKKKNLRTVDYFTPKNFILKHVNLKRKTSKLSEEERQLVKDVLIKKSKEIQFKRNAKLKANLVYVQEVCPSYVKELIKSYFKIRRENTLDINARYLILLEASQFKCKETIDFLHKISACEKNNDLRLMAFYSLQRMGEHPWLGRTRKGRKRLSQLKPINVEKNPTELLHLLYSHQHLVYQQFDVFLSHSSLDIKELLNLKAKLNRQNLTVYIDWVNDRVVLNRENQNEDTWLALELRMDQSKSLLFVMTDNSIQSPYTKREVEYFKAHHKPVFVYQPYTITLNQPEYLNGSKACTIQAEKIIFP